MDYFLDVDGVHIHIKITIRNVRKPFIIFLHDSLGCVESWKDFPEKLGKTTGLNTLVYDRQGYGTSDAFADSDRDNKYLEREADVLHHIIEQLELKRVVLFGHSDGGSIALIAAAKYPTEIKGVITEGAHVFVEEITLEGIRKAVNRFETTDLKDRLTKYHGTKTQAVFDAWTKTWMSDDFTDWNLEEFLPEIQCPSLIIQGEDDEYGSTEQVEKIASQTTGNSEVLLLPSIGHSPHKHAPEQVLKQATRFLGSIFPQMALAATQR